MKNYKTEIKFARPYSYLLFFGAFLFAFLTVALINESGLNHSFFAIVGIVVGILYIKYIAKWSLIPFNKVKNNIAKGFFYYLYILSGVVPFLIPALIATQGNDYSLFGLSKTSLLVISGAFLSTIFTIYGMMIYRDK